MTSTGQTGATEQPRKWRWTPGGGFENTRTFEGVSESSRAQKELELQAGGWEYEAEQGANWRIIAKRGGAQDSPTTGGSEQTKPLSDEWFLDTRTIEKDILESDDQYVAQIEAENLDVLKRYAQGQIEYSALTFVGTGAPLAAAIKISTLINRGLRSKRIDQPILRHVKTVSNKYAIKESRTNVGKIIKASSINALENVDPNLRVALPQEYAANNYNATTFNMKYGWFKGSPTVSPAGIGRYQIATEFEWGLWPYDTIFTFV